jgi:hypothetical protein
MAETETGPTPIVIDSLKRSRQDAQNSYGDPGIEGWLAGRDPLQKVEYDSVSPKDLVVLAARKFREMLSKRSKKGKTTTATSFSK